MSQQVPVRQPSLAGQVLGILVERIKNGTYSSEKPLPPEHQLSREFNVSRTTVRSALDILSANGYVVRHPGVGTFLSKLAQVSDPLNQMLNFTDLLTRHGFAANYVQLEAELVRPGISVAEKLDVDAQSNVLKYSKLFTADDMPVIFSINHIPEWVIKDKITKEEAFRSEAPEPLFIHFADVLKQPISYFISTISPRLASDCPLPDALKVNEPNTPILVIEQVGYNPSDEAVLHAVEYHPDNRIGFKLIRRGWPPPSHRFGGNIGT